ncbi:hypothetical protein XPA_005881 [Xanthoria parietina]
MIAGVVSLYNNISKMSIKLDTNRLPIDPEAPTGVYRKDSYILRPNLTSSFKTNVLGYQASIKRR